MNRNFVYSLLITLVIMISVFGAYTATKGFVANEEKGFNEKIAAVETQIAAVNASIAKITGENTQTALSLKEIRNRQSVENKSQSQLLTEAVAKVTPSVVSVVISKDVPQLQVVYENPFGNDPFFQNFNIQVPVYQQKGTKNEQVGAGSGFLITSDGYILTNRHVVEDDTATYTVLLSNGTQKPAKVIYKDPNKDIAIIKISGTGYKPLPLGDSNSVQLGQSVIAVGNALGQYNNSVSVGIISGLNRSIEAADQTTGQPETLTGVLQTDAAINPGNSGGPLVDLSGNVIGINVATVVGSNNVSFSIPINSVKSIIHSQLGI